MFLYSRYNALLGITSEEIVEISREITQNFTPNPSSILPRYVSSFSPQELLSISEEISRDFSPSVVADVSELVILPVDPEHLYAYWTVVEDNSISQPSDPEESLTLHIYSEPTSTDSEARPVEDTSTWYDFIIENNRSHWGVQLPVPTSGTTYSAEIGRFDIDNSFIPLINSTNQIHVPRAAEFSRDAVRQISEFNAFELPHVQLVRPVVFPVSDNSTYPSVISSLFGVQGK